MAHDDSLTDETDSRYRIGAVCRMTGISQHVLRVWEKRYGVVDPLRSDNQRRLYSDSDVRRLSLLKSLVDRGHAIGSIAELDDVALENRLQQSEQRIEALVPAQTPRLLLIGQTLQPIASTCAASDVFEFVGHYAEPSRISADERADVAVLERPNLHPESAAEIKRIVTELNLRLLVLVYEFASRSSLERLRDDRIVTLRAPLDVNTLEAVVTARFAVAASVTDGPVDSVPPPSRRFNDRQLAHLAAQSGDVECECPRHLALLVGRLAHFEAYSAECEGRSPADAELHRMLYHVTANVRDRMEQALAKVAEAEGLSPDPED